MEDRLKYILQFVNDWLKFSEAKNGALAALVGVILSKFSSELLISASGWVWWCNAIGICSIAISGILSLLSFVPNLTFRWKPKTNEQSATRNLFYFGNIADMSPFDYLDAIYQADACGSNPNKKLEVDLAGQIVTNSGIAMRKYRYFTLALKIALIGFVLIGIANFAIGILHSQNAHI